MDASVKRGDIFYADLSPVVGSEQGGTRPVLIVQNDTGNRHSPTVIAAAYLIIIKGFRLNSPILVGGLIAVYALNHLALMSKDFSGILSGILLIASAGVFLVTGLGYIPNRLPLLICAAVLAVFRVVAVDVFGHILPLSEFQPFAYLMEASSLFGFLAVAFMCPAMQVTVLPNADTDRTSAESKDARATMITIA